MNDLKTPDVTLVQIIAVLGAGFALAAAFGLDISQDKQNAIVQLVTVLAPIVIAADAVIRHGRARAMIVPPKGEVEAAPRVARKPAAKR